MKSGLVYFCFSSDFWPEDACPFRHSLQHIVDAHRRQFLLFRKALQFLKGHNRDTLVHELAVAFFGFL